MIVSLLLILVGSIIGYQWQAISDITNISNELLLDRHKKTGACSGSGFQ
jgi:hypothetical protein